MHHSEAFPRTFSHTVTCKVCLTASKMLFCGFVVLKNYCNFRDLELKTNSLIPNLFIYFIVSTIGFSHESANSTTTTTTTRRLFNKRIQQLFQVVDTNGNTTSNEIEQPS